MNLVDTGLRQIKIEYMQDYIYQNLISAAKSTEYSIDFLGMDIPRQYATRKGLKQAAFIAAEYVVDHTPENSDTLSEEQSVQIMSEAIQKAFEQTKEINGN
jgi:hypothetical protein